MSPQPSSLQPDRSAGHSADLNRPRTFTSGALVQLVGGEVHQPNAEVATLAAADVTVSSSAVTAEVGSNVWQWSFDEVSSLHHGRVAPWTILTVPGVPDHGVAVHPDEVGEFRAMLHAYFGAAPRPPAGPPALDGTPRSPFDTEQAQVVADVREDTSSAANHVSPNPGTSAFSAAPPPAAQPAYRYREADPVLTSAARPLDAPVGLEAREISAWFGTHQVLDRVSLEMRAGEVTALIGPSGCGKSTFLRILNRMHEMTLGAGLAGEVLLAGADIYDPARKLTDARRQIGMVFQKPNPFPAMSIYDNVVAGFQLTGVKVSGNEKDSIVESCLRRAGLWNEVKDRLRQPGGSLSGGQQQRLCIARALAVRPKVLLMDEPCSALDPTSTRRIEETIAELRDDLTIVIVTHNMQQAARVSGVCAFFLAEQGTPGVIVEHGPTDAMFGSPRDSRTNDYVNGRFG